MSLQTLSICWYIIDLFYCGVLLGFGDAFLESSFSKDRDDLIVLHKTCIVLLFSSFMCVFVCLFSDLPICGSVQNCVVCNSLI